MKAILTRFHGPTNFKGSRYSAKDEDGNRVVLSADYALSCEENHNRAAIMLCRKMGWTHELVRGSVKGGYVYCFDHSCNRPRVAKR